MAKNVTLAARRPPRFRALVTALALGGLAACFWAETKVQTVRVVPGPMALPGVTHLLLSDFEGPGGAEVAHNVAAKLLQRRSFAVTDLTASRPFYGYDPSAYAPAHDSRSALGADAGIVASVVQHEIEDDFQIEEGHDAYGRPLTRYVRSGTLHLQVMFRAVDPRTGALFDARSEKVALALGEDSVQVDEAASRDGDYVQALFVARDTPSLFFAAYQQLAEQFCDAIEMQLEATEVTLYHDRNVAGSLRALEGVRRGDWTQALSIYRDYVGQVDRDGAGEGRKALRAMAHYNLGVAYAHSGALAKGLYELEWSQAIDDTALVQKELARVRTWLWEAQAPRRAWGTAAQ